jgi:transglutaminase-like putative cysteine protease
MSGGACIFASAIKMTFIPGETSEVFKTSEVLLMLSRLHLGIIHQKGYSMNLFRCFTACLLLLCCCLNSHAAPFGKIDAPPLSERWFGIYVNGERVGFYRQRIDKVDDGYRMEGDGSVRMKVMSFSKEASMRETYLVAKNLALRSFDVEQTINGSLSHVSGKVTGSALTIKSEANGKTTDKILKFKGDLFPGPALNFYPLLRTITAGAVHKIQSFDPEEVKIKEIQITVLGEEKTSDGLPALKLRNNLYPFVNNDIWVDSQGNTLEESVRDGLVTTKAEEPKALGSFISDWALAKKDLIYDFSMVRVQPPLKNPAKLTGLVIEISNWHDSLPLLQGGGQQVEKKGSGQIIIKTGTLAKQAADAEAVKADDQYLKSIDKIESDAPEIKAQAAQLATGTKSREDLVKALAFWTAERLEDTIDDSGSAVTSFKLKSGNCQSHARLYTALARAAGVPSKFVSGLVYLEGKGFLYHSWAESLVNGRWIAVDPTYNQFPADPTHLKLLEGHLPEDLAPIIAIIGRIKIAVVEAAY